MLRSGEWLNLRQMYEDGVSVSEIARRTGFDRKTVRKWAKKGNFPRRTKKPKPSKLDPFKPYILERMKAGVLNAEVILREIRDRGYDGQIRILRAFMQPYRPVVTGAATVRFETEPGKQMQIDWACFGYIVEEGVKKRLYCFVAVLSYSRTLYLEFTTSMTQSVFLQCHINAFNFFGGIPEEILYDNPKVVTTGRDAEGEVIWNQCFLDFAGYYGFKPRVCRPYRARTKGKVERPIRYIRENFFAGIEFGSLFELNHKASVWRDNIANVRVHATTLQRPIDRLKEENLKPVLGIPEYEPLEVGIRRVLRDCIISYHRNYYSVPWELVGRDVIVRVSPKGILTVEWQGKIVASHKVAEGRFKRVIDPGHYQGIPDGKKQRVEKVIEFNKIAELKVEVRSLEEYEQIALGVAGVA